MNLLQANPQAQHLLVMSPDDFQKAIHEAVTAALNDKAEAVVPPTIATGGVIPMTTSATGLCGAPKWQSQRLAGDRVTDSKDKSTLSVVRKKACIWQLAISNP